MTPFQASHPRAVDQSVRWFTASTPEFEPAPGRPDCLVVVAQAYRLGLAHDGSAE